MAAFSDIEQLGRAWRQRARHAEYLWEVVIPEEDLDSHLALIGELYPRISFSPDASFALAAIAVNWAYYRQEEADFRKPFTCAVLGYPDVIVWNDQLGPAAAVAIAQWEGTEPRSGSYAYVGPVIEHSGVPRRRLGQFVDLLRLLHDYPGWLAVAGTAAKGILPAVGTAFGTHTYASEFLQTDKGLNLVRSCCAVLENYLSGFLDRRELDSSEGYRPGFLAEVAELLKAREVDIERERSIRKGKGRLPRADALFVAEFVLDPDRPCLLLRFDPSATVRRQLYCNGIDGPVLRSALEIGSHLGFASRFSGTFRFSSGKTAPWEVPAWVPKGMDWAVFDMHGAFVASKDDKDQGSKTKPVPIRPGTYYLVVDEGLGLSPQEEEALVRVDCGLLETGEEDLGRPYRVVQAQLTAATALEGMRVVGEEETRLPDFLPMGKESWSNLTELDAVWTRSPILRLTGWTEWAAQRFMVKGLFEGVEQRLEVKTVGPDLAELVLPGDLQAPYVARIWLEHKGRARDGRQIPLTFRFACWPGCEIQFPRSLHAERDEPLVTIRPSDGGRFEPEFGGQPVGHPDDGSYRIAPGVAVFSGSIRSEHGSIQLRIPIYRAAFRLGNARGEPLWLTPRSIRHMVDAHLSVAQVEVPRLELTALPAVQAVLAIRDIATGSRLALLTAAMGPSGRRRVLANEVYDALISSGIPIGRFDVACGNQAIPVSAWFVDPQRLDSTADDDFADEALPEAFKIGWLVRKGQVPALQPDQDWPTDLAAWAWKWIAARTVFDEDSALTPEMISRLEEAISQLLRAASALFAAAASALTVADIERAQQVLHDLIQADLKGQLDRSGIGLDRWKSKIDLALKKLGEISDVHDRVKQLVQFWKGLGVRPPEVPDVIAQLGCQYYKASCADSTQGIEFLRNGVAPLLNRIATVRQPLWRECGTVVAAISWMRLGCIKKALATISTSSTSRSLGNVWAQLASLAAVISGERIRPSGSGHRMALELVSPRDDDARLGRAVAQGDLEAWSAAADADWLSAWLAWRWSAAQQQPAAVQQRFLSLIKGQLDTIPRDAPDRERIANEVDREIHGDWNA